MSNSESQPAVFRFPPKNAKPHYPDVAQPFTQSSPAVLPEALIAQSDIWDEQKRGTLKKPKYKKKDLDERRSKVCITLAFHLVAFAHYE